METVFPATVKGREGTGTWVRVLRANPSSPAVNRVLQMRARNLNLALFICKMGMFTNPPKRD